MTIFFVSLFFKYCFTIDTKNSLIWSHCFFLSKDFYIIKDKKPTINPIFFYAYKINFIFHILNQIKNIMIELFDVLPEEKDEIKKILNKDMKNTAVVLINEDIFNPSYIFICKSQWFDLHKNQWIYINNSDNLIFYPLQNLLYNKIIWENLLFLHNPQLIPKTIIHPKEMQSILLSLYFYKQKHPSHLLLRNRQYKIKKIYTYKIKNYYLINSYKDTSSMDNWDTIYFYNSFFKLVYPWDYNIIMVKANDAQQSDSNFLQLKQNLKFFHCTINDGQINEHDHFIPHNNKKIIINLPNYYIKEFNKNPHKQYYFITPNEK